MDCRGRGFMKKTARSLPNICRTQFREAQMSSFGENPPRSKGGDCQSLSRRSDIKHRWQLKTSGALSGVGWNRQAEPCTHTCGFIAGCPECFPCLWFIQYGSALSPAGRASRETGNQTSFGRADSYSFTLRVQVRDGSLSQLNWRAPTLFAVLLPPAIVRHLLVCTFLI